MKLVNGEPATGLDLADRAIQFGDGVFRTLKVVDGRVPFWGRHYAKLHADCAALGITCPSEETLLTDVRRLAVNDAVVKIMVTRGVSERGYAIPPQVAPVRIVLAAALPVYPEALYAEGVALRVCATRASWQPALAGIKHLNRLENVLARREWHDPAIFEGLLLDRDGLVTEGVFSNVLILQGREVLTPALQSSGVAGVMRGIVMELFADKGYRVIPSDFDLDSLLKSEQVWLCNSLFGVLPVRALATRQWPVLPLSLQVRQSLALRAAQESLSLR